jgi:hypothetical protein
MMLSLVKQFATVGIHARIENKVAAPFFKVGAHTR